MAMFLFTHDTKRDCAFPTIRKEMSRTLFGIVLHLDYIGSLIRVNGAHGRLAYALRIKSKTKISR